MVRRTGETSYLLEKCNATNVNMEDILNKNASTFQTVLVTFDILEANITQSSRL